MHHALSLLSSQSLVMIDSPIPSLQVCLQPAVSSFHIDGKGNLMRRGVFVMHLQPESLMIRYKVHIAIRPLRVHQLTKNSLWLGVALRGPGCRV